MSERMNLTLTDEAIAALNRRATDRKRGELVSRLIVEHDRAVAHQIAIEELQKRVAELEEKIEERATHDN